MAESGAAQRRSGSALLGRAAERLPFRADWTRVGPSVRGPLLTLATAIVFDVLARNGLPIAHPFPFLMLTLIYSAYSGGLRPGLISALLTFLYALHFLSQAGAILRYTPENAYSLLAFAIVLPATVVLVARVHDAARRARAIQLTRTEVERVERRLAFFAEANATLASSLDYTLTLRDLARLIVPTLADWCAIHVASEHGTLQFVSGAHRDPAKDLLVRALCEYGSERPPFGTARRHSELGEVTEEVLRANAGDAEQLKLFRALSPTAFIRVPMLARGRSAGTITLAVGSESGRRYDSDDLAFAEELANRAALAVDNARLYRSAHEADERYGMLFESNPQPMWVFDVDTLAFLEVNEAAVRHYGYSRDEFLSMTIMDLLPPENAPTLHHHGLERSGSRRGDVALAQHQRKDGTILDMELVSHEMELNGRRARLVLGTDVSERTRTRAALLQSEEQLRQAQRMDAAGRLAGGVAHDFNNLLTTIRGFSDLLLHDFPEDHPRRKDLEQIQKAADRGVLLTRQLLTFGHQPTPQPRLLELNATVTNMEGLMQRLVGADIRLVSRLRPGLGEVKIDPGQLEQVLINLVLNARDAMPVGGTLTIETGERQISGSTRGRSVKPGRYLVLAVSDTGSGVVGESLPHVFDPFFTSQAAGTRSGLGLSIVYGIAKQNGGGVRVSSEPGEGTTVKVFLPRAEGDEPAPGERPSLQGEETVLVVEDEDGVRELLWKILSNHGHTVLEARHGKDALAVASGYSHPIHLLVTDVVMPEMGAGELVDQLVARRPDLKVLYISGYTNDEIMRRGVGGTDIPFVQKPFTSEDLMRKVREVLDRKA